MSIDIAWHEINHINGIMQGHPAFIYHRTCPVCNSMSSRSVWKLDEFQFFTDAFALNKRVNINVHLCLDCYALYLNPAYSQLGFEHLFAQANCSYGAQDFEARVNEEIEWLKQRDLLKTGAHVLDIGCYKGDFLQSMPEYLRCTGVDIDKTAIDYARNKYSSERMNFVWADFENFEISDSPDLITMFHVLEHLPNPLKVLIRLRSLADKNTRLLIEVPIIENGFTNDINGFFSVQHMTHFSRNSLKNIVSVAGWRIEEMFEQKDYNGCRVLCSPDIQTSHITKSLDDLSLCYKYLSHWYQSLSDIENILKQYKMSGQWVIWGAGLHTEFVYQVTSFFNIDSECEYIIVDSDKEKQGKTWRNIHIYNPDILQQLDLNKIKFLISSYGGQPSIEKALLEMGVQKDNIVKLYKQLKVY